MEYLVTMTTTVPDGTADATVADIRAREAAHSAELAAEGNLLRLWRPPLQPGQWRSIGLFAALDDDDLEKVLASMPLRIWRSDDVRPLEPHPNDPEMPGRAPFATEYLITMTTIVPEGTPVATVTETRQREAVRARELAAGGHLMRLWGVSSSPRESRTIGVWSADDGLAMQAIVESLPLSRWMTAQSTPLTEHPSDPALTLHR